MTTLRYLISEQGGIFSESYYVREGWNFSFITWKFGNSVENCSEIVKRACSFNRYLPIWIDKNAVWLTFKKSRVFEGKLGSDFDRCSSRTVKAKASEAIWGLYSDFDRCSELCHIAHPRLLCLHCLVLWCFIKNMHLDFMST